MALVVAAVLALTRTAHQGLLVILLSSPGAHLRRNLPHRVIRRNPRIGPTSLRRRIAKGFDMGTRMSSRQVCRAVRHQLREKGGCPLRVRTDVAGSRATS